ncbi:response regulator [Candidatus Saccharibacteria bacterium]|nr:response regulator [Candidatus Saccharibacteria bacterium]NCS82900.1 response regulator [Candidatus Saccharibacteria bacterium]
MAKILLVEDDKSLREIYGVRLQAEGYDIVSAGDGEEALALAIKERPDLIVSDVMMPKISGFDMLDILRSTTETKDVKVIMMTALSSEDQRARGESLGADRYLVKSQVGIEDVVRTVHEVLADDSAGGGAPAPAATPATFPPVPPVPTAPTTPNPAPAQETPASQPPIPSIINTPPEVPAMQPQQPTTPNDTPTPAPAPQSQPQPDTLPQPTAPFSSPAPESLGDQVRANDAPSPIPDAPAPDDTNPGPLGPIPSDASTTQPLDLSSQIAQELAGTEAEAPQTPAPEAPAPAPVETQPEIPTQPQIPQTPPQTEASETPAAPAAPVVEQPAPTPTEEQPASPPTQPTPGSS